MGGRNGDQGTALRVALHGDEPSTVVKPPRVARGKAKQPTKAEAVAPLATAKQAKRVRGSRNESRGGGKSGETPAALAPVGNDAEALLRELERELE